MAHRPKSIRHLLKDRPLLSRLDHEIGQQQAVLEQVRQCLPDELARHCLGARLAARQLVLHTDSPVWASRLRYQAKQLQSLLHRTYPELSEVKVRLLIADKNRPQRRSVARHSNRAAEIVRDSAADTGSAPLKAALLRLSRALKSS